MDTTMMQVVDYEETFNQDLEAFLKRNGLSSRGFDYNVAAIMGPQSSGKSTLLNLLFGTSFRTMDADSGRYQVTQGVWLGNDDQGSIVVMDLEGTDSRERGEDAATFERKSALFALALAEVLIINVWTQDVGRYNAANLSLLKTIMELDMQLFYGGSSKSPTPVAPRMHKTRLLFVLRDHYAVEVGGTPMERLRSVLAADVDKIWNTIAKPEAAVGTSFSNYFDLDFFALPHKVLEPEQFKAAGRRLREKFHNGDLFLKEYSRGVAADGFSSYAESVWETVRANKELDIPTQKEMLAHVRCEQIARDAMVEVDAALAPLRASLLPVNGEKLAPVPDLYEILLSAVDAALQAYDESASRYSRSVAEMKSNDLHSKLGSDCKALYDAQVTAVSDSAIARFRRSVGEISGGDAMWHQWGARSRNALASALDVFDTNCKVGSLDPSVMPPAVNPHPLSFAAISYATARKRLENVLVDELNRATATAASKAREACLKMFQTSFKSPVGTVFDTADDDAWERASEVADTAWKKTTARAADAYGSNGLGLDVQELEITIEDKLKPDCYEIAVTDIKEIIGTASTFLMRMAKRFDDKFRFDDRGVPRHFGPDEDLESLFMEARDEGEKLIDILAEIKLKGTLPRMRASCRDLDRELLNPTVFESHTQLELREKLRRQAGAVFVEAKRAQEAAKITTKIPVWLFALLVILGWNEIMMVLSNPLLLVLTVLIVPVVYFGYMMDAPTMLGPALRTAAGPYVRMARDFIDDYAPQEPEPAGQHVQVPNGNASYVTDISKND
jgi:protein SEY1